MKVRLLAVMAVVVVGVMAGTSPAMAKKAHIASAWSHQHADNKKFGEAIHNLRIRTDLTNYTVGQITAASIEALTALKSGLTTIAGYTTDFKYGVVQVGAAGLSGGVGSGIAGLGPAFFAATPNIQPTGEQSTVSFPIPPIAALGGTAIKLFVAVRSANPGKGTVVCRVTMSDSSPVVSAVSGAVISATKVGSLAGTGYFKALPQSRLSPENGSKAFPYSLVETEDNVINMADPIDLATGTVAQHAGAAPGLAHAPFASVGSSTGTLSCLVS